MVNDKTNINVHRSNGNVVLEKNAQSIVDRKENQFRNSKYSKQYKKAYEQHQEKTSRISRPCDEKARAFVDNRKDRRKKKQRSSKNKNTRRYRVIPCQIIRFLAIFPRTSSDSFEIWHTCRNCLENNILQIFFYLGQARSEIWSCEKMEK